LTNTIADLKHDPKNARRHNPRNIGVIADSLQKVGAARSIVIDENNVILAGNGVVEAAGQVGLEDLQIVESDGNKIIAVRRVGLTPEQKTRLALADNRASDLSDFDPQAIAALLEEGFDMAGMFTGEEISTLMSGAADAIVPDFQPVGEDEQGRLDQKKPVTCPECGHEFIPK